MWYTNTYKYKVLVQKLKNLYLVYILYTQKLYTSTALLNFCFDILVCCIITYTVRGVYHSE